MRRQKPGKGHQVTVERREFVVGGRTILATNIPTATPNMWIVVHSAFTVFGVVALDPCGEVVHWITAPAKRYKAEVEQRLRGVFGPWDAWEGMRRGRSCQGVQARGSKAEERPPDRVRRGSREGGRV